ncbi:hypothetical protein FGG08_007488, partial [Glutinoglossum americanum]
VFARGVTAGWEAWGSEAVRFNWVGWWEEGGGREEEEREEEGEEVIKEMEEMKEE